MMIRSFLHKYVLFWKCDFDLICCLETAMGRRKYHRGKRVRISGVQWCLSQVGRIIANFFKSHSSDCKRNVEQTIHPPWYSNDLNEFPVHHQWNIKVSVHPHTGKSLRADFRFLPWNRSVVFWIGTFTLFFRRNASSMLPYIQQVMKPDGLMVIYLYCIGLNQNL